MAGGGVKHWREMSEWFSKMIILMSMAFKLMMTFLK
jgi:hypothetical protein